MKFSKPPSIDLSTDEYYNDVKNIIIIPNSNTIIKGTYKKYGKENACDMDITQSLIYENGKIPDKFFEYIKNLKANKSKIHLVKSRIKIKHRILENLYKELGHLNGNLEIINNGREEDIKNIINQLSDNLRTPILELYDKYLNNKNLYNYVSLKKYIKSYFYPFWSFDDILKKEIDYEGVNISINKDLPDMLVYFIEIIYKRFRVSNVIFIGVKHSHAEIYKKSSLQVSGILDELYIDENHLDYYKLLKSFINFIKFLYINKLLTEFPLIKNNIKLYDDLNEFKKKLGENRHHECINTNMMDIAYLKLQKYTKLNNKDKIKKYQRKYDKYHNRDVNANINLSKLCKQKYLEVAVRYKKYLQNNIIIT